ncbi:hypothetical protein V8E55_008025 [Tylopilus felleus]
MTGVNSDADESSNCHAHAALQQTQSKQMFLDRYPSNAAGHPVSTSFMPDANHRYAEQLTCQVDASSGGARNPYWPFTSQLDWEVARWARMHGPGSTAVSELFGINSLASCLGLSYTNSRELNRIIDKKIPHTRPQFRREEIVVAGEAFDVYIRDIIECIKSLFGDPEFTPHLLLCPERHFTDSTKQENAYLDMNTGTWWWKTQQEIESTKPGATIIPVIISSDKTQLTLFRNKCAVSFKSNRSIKI